MRVLGSRRGHAAPHEDARSGGARRVMRADERDLEELPRPLGSAICKFARNDPRQLLRPKTARQTMPARKP